MYLIDTNVLIFATLQQRDNHELADAAIERLLGQGQEPYVIPQVIAEFWNVCTRPRDKNGYGYTKEQAELEVQRIETDFLVLKSKPSMTLGEV